MRNTPSFLGSLALFTIFGCASSPPPGASTPADPSMAEPAPPAPPPPAADPAPAPAPEPTAAPAPAPAPAEEKPAPTAGAKPHGSKSRSTTSAKAPAGNGSATAKPTTTESAQPNPTTAGYTGPDACKLAVKGDSPVAQACRDGGAKAAKAKMKELVKRAKDNGQKFQCDDCHRDAQDITKLTPDAPDRFKKLLAAAK
jgi:hypothetical protein